ncbi:MAG: hypothetical protein ACJZ4V_04410 [Candidatus Poseidoniaceae archaeon]
MQNTLNLSKPIFISLIMVLSTTLVPGCLDGSSDDEESGVNATAPATPREAMGLWLPTIDGHIGQQSGTLYGEWMDSYRQDIELTDQDGNLASAELMVKTVDHSISLAMTSTDFDVSPAKILVHLNDRTLISQVEGNPALSYMSMDCELIDCEIMAPVSPVTDGRSISRLDSLVPMAPVNSIASTFTFMTKNLVTEATALNFFTDSTQANVTIEIMVDGKEWIYEQAFNFDWILPLIYPTTDVSIERIEVTQAIQTANNDVRLVEGKDTLVRVFIDSGDFTTVDVKVTLQYCILVFCVKSIEKIHTAVQNPQRENYLDSANFQLPADWVTHPGIDDPIPIGLFAKVEHISPDGEIAYLDTNTANDKLFHVAWFNATHDLNVHYVPLTVNGSTVPQSDANLAFRAMDALLPTNVNVIEIDTNWFTAASDYNAGDFKNHGINLLHFIMIFSEHYNAFPYPDQLVLLHPYQDKLLRADGVSLCGSSTPDWSGQYETAGYVTISKVSNTCIKGHTPSHEMNHNLGPLSGTYTVVDCVRGAVDVNGNGKYDPGIDECREEESETFTWGNDPAEGTWGGHIGPECDAEGDDTEWTRIYGSDRTIEDLGWTSFFPNTETNEDSLISPDIRELMGYCRSSDLNEYFTKWISIYRWDRLYDLFSDFEVGNPDGRSDEGDTRFVSFVLGDHGTGKLQYTYTVEDSAIKVKGGAASEAGERYEIRSYDNTKQLIDTAVIVKNSHHIHETHEGLEIEEYTSMILLKETIPATELHLVYIDQNGNETLVDSFYDDSKQPQISVDSIPAEISSRDEKVTISWSIADATEMPDVLYQLEYSWTNDIWLPIGIPSRNNSMSINFGTMPGSDQAAFRVKAMNGMKIAYATTNSFVLPYQNPTLNMTFSENLHDGKLNYGEAFDFEIKFTDPDWAAPNLDSFKARLVNEQGNVVWGEGAQITNRLITKLIHSGGSSSTGSAGIEGQEKGDNWQGDVHGQTHNFGIRGHSQVGISFPNDQILNAELIPGNYKLEVEYTDEHGGIVTEKFEFVIEVGPKQTVEYRERLLENYHNDLVQPVEGVPDLGQKELQYVVTLQMVEAGFPIAMKDFSAVELGEMMMIPESRRNELISIADEFGNSEDYKD